MRQDVLDADLRAHLQAVHDGAAGFTESCAVRCVNADGLNSYAWLCDAAHPPAGGAMLDLACGSGVLLEMCRARHGERVALTGVDMSRAELELASARLADKAVTLHEALAQKLSFAEESAYDAVLCHWALTVMRPLPAVLDEVARVLRPGGVFAAIVDGPTHTAAGYGEICALIERHVAQADSGYAELGDPRARDGAALSALAQAHFPGAKITIESDVFALEDPPERLAAETAGFFYSCFILDDDQRSAMLDELTAFFAAMATPRYEMPVNRLRVVKA